MSDPRNVEERFTIKVDRKNKTVKVIFYPTDRSPRFMEISDPDASIGKSIMGAFRDGMWKAKTHKYGDGE